MQYHQKFGVEVGQVYLRADGSKENVLFVTDVETYADVGDVVVFDTAIMGLRRIDAFKLAMVRYYLFNGEVK